jgi:hypothetical protein
MANTTKPHAADDSLLQHSLYFAVVRGGAVLLPSGLYDTADELQQAARAVRRRFCTLSVRVVDTDTKRLFPGLLDLRPQLIPREDDEP